MGRIGRILHFNHEKLIHSSQHKGHQLICMDVGMYICMYACMYVGVGAQILDRLRFIGVYSYWPKSVCESSRPHFPFSSTAFFISCVNIMRAYLWWLSAYVLAVSLFWGSFATGGRAPKLTIVKKPHAKCRPKARRLQSHQSDSDPRASAMIE